MKWLDLRCDSNYFFALFFYWTIIFTVRLNETETIAPLWSKIGSVWPHINHLKSAAMHIFKIVCYRKYIDLSNEVLNVHLGQGASKLWSLKTRGQEKLKKRCRCIRAFISFPFIVHRRILPKIKKFNVGELWGLAALQSLDQNEDLASHLKDLFHIYLEPEAQRHSCVSNLCFAISN